MRELMSEEEKKWLLEYCMEPENTKLALEIGEIKPELERRILSSFLEKLVDSVNRKLGECGLHWRTCIQEDLQEELEKQFAILLIMTMEEKKRETEIHFGLCRYPQDKLLYVGTHRERKNKQIPWPACDLASFMEKPGIRRGDDSRHWWFDPIDMHRCISGIKGLSELNDDKLRCGKIKYFTDKLVRYAETISKALEE